MKRRVCPVASLLLAVLFVVPTSAQQIDRGELEALRARVRELEQQLRSVVERLDRAESGARATMAESPPPAAPQVGVTDRAGTLESADSANALRLRGLVQTDVRLFFGSGQPQDSLVLRRARLITEGGLARTYSYQFVTEFGGNSINIRDANLAMRIGRGYELKAGKFKPPVGLELLQTADATSLVERSLVTGFVPLRDVGVQFGTAGHHRRLSFAFGVYNGVPDGSNTDHFDHDSGKDVAGRLMWRPFAEQPESPGQGLALGVGASHGRQHGQAARSGGYRTFGQQYFFAYRGPVMADGDTSRVSPQFDYRTGPLGLTGEYIVSRAELRPEAGAGGVGVQHRGWQLTSAYVLSGENSTALGLVPRADFNAGAGTWGAVELVARYAAVRFDARAFPQLADPEASASEAGAWGLGLNWQLKKAVRFMFNYSYTSLERPELNGTAGDRGLPASERLFVSRLQLAF